MNIFDEPRRFRNFAELDAAVDARLEAKRRQMVIGAAVTPSAGLCPDCGGDRPRSATRCPRCAKIRSRTMARERQRKRRASKAEQVSRFSEIAPCNDKGLQANSDGDGPDGPVVQIRDTRATGTPNE